MFVLNYWLREFFCLLSLIALMEVWTKETDAIVLQNSPLLVETASQSRFFVSLQTMVTNVSSLLKTVRSVEDEAQRGVRAIESTVDAVKQAVVVSCFCKLGEGRINLALHLETRMRKTLMFFKTSSWKSCCRSFFPPRKWQSQSFGSWSLSPLKFGDSA